MEKCPFCTDKAQCNLKDGLKHQGLHGGFQDRSLDSNKGTGGPYWTEPIWTDFVKRTIEAANNGCLHPEDVISLAKRITEEKKGKGELI